MNSIRQFVEHLMNNSQTTINHLPTLVCPMDSHLLEKGFIGHHEFQSFPCISYSWVVIYYERPYFISGFGVTANEVVKPNTVVWIHLRRILEGKKLPFSIEPVGTESVHQLLTEGPKMRLASCPKRTFGWLKYHPATKKIIERITQVA